MSMSGHNFNHKDNLYRSKSSKFQQDNFSQSMIPPQNHLASSKSFYVQNENPLNQTAPLLFKERSGKLKWKEILRIDLDNVAKTNDLSPIEGLLDNLVFANIDENDMQVMPENSVVKLVKTYQYILEYLLYVQQKKESENKFIEDNYKNIINDACIKETLLKENKSIINTLKKDNRQKEQIITTYKFLLDEYKKGNMGATEKNILYECGICEDKKFINQASLNKHYQKRHPKSNYGKEENYNKQYANTNAVINNDNFSNNFQNMKSSTVIDNPKLNEIEKNIEDMKQNFEGYLKSNVNEQYMKLYETQKSLEHNVKELKGDKSKLNHIEESINKMMKKINKLKEKTKEKEKERETVNLSTPMSEKFKEESFIQHTEKLNQQITDVYRYNNQKIDKISENLEDFKKIIMNQLEEINKKNNRSNLIKEQIDYNKEDTKRSNRLQNELHSQNVEKLSCSKNFKEELIIKEEQNSIVKKRLFNASRHIESDNSEDEKKQTNLVPERGIGEEKPNAHPEKGYSHQFTQPPSDASKSNKINEKDYSSISHNYVIHKDQKIHKEIDIDETLEEVKENIKIVYNNIDQQTNSNQVCEGKGYRDKMREKMASVFTLKDPNVKEIKDESYLSQNEKNKIKEDIHTISDSLKRKEEENVGEKLDKFYYEFGQRENDLYLNKIKLDNYNQLKNSDYQTNEEISKFINTTVNDKLVSWNKENNINFNDLSSNQTQNILEYISNIKEETKNKCENNEYYKIYFEKLISELKLDEYMKIENRKNNSTSENTSKKIKEIPKSSLSISNKENDELSNLRKEINNKLNKSTKRDFDEDFIEKKTSNKKTKAVDKLDNDEFDY